MEFVRQNVDISIFQFQIAFRINRHEINDGYR